MKKINFDIEAIGIYWNDWQRQQYKNGMITDDLVNECYIRLQTCLGINLPIYTNEPLLTKAITDIKIISENEEANFLRAVSSQLPDSKFEDEDLDEVFLAYIKGIYPLLDTELSLELKDRHIKYFSSYSYSENLPAGIVPYYISREFIQSLPADVQDVHAYLLKNINQYDTEIFYQAPDLRQLRLDFSLADLRSINICRQLKEQAPFTYQQLLPILQQQPQILRSVPSYLELEIYRGCQYQCSFCPRQYLDNSADGNYMSQSMVANILEQWQKDLPGQLTVCLGGMGEPFMHPHWLDILDTILNYSEIKEVIIETALYVEPQKFIQYYQNLTSDKQEKLSLIINLPSHERATYTNITGQDNLTAVEQHLEQIRQVVLPQKLHVQILKIQQVETEIDQYFNHFEKQKIAILLQKYNRYAGLMPEKRVSDLTPIHRDFCWHLARDLYIDVNGEVYLCRQLHQIQTLGNIHKTTLKEIWQAGNTAFAKSFQGQHNEVAASCLACDEWYTFNA